MRIHNRNSAQVTSSLTTSAFRVVLARDQRGLVYRVRKDIPSLRLLFQTPIAVPPPKLPRGRIRTLRAGTSAR